MGRPQVERIVYPATRECVTATPTTNTPAPNFWSLDHDARNWVAQGKNFTAYRHDRDFAPVRKPASASDFYNTDQGAKMALTHRVQRSPYRYVSMRSQSAGRDGGNYLGTSIGTGGRVGPGTYSPHAQDMPRQEPLFSVLASGSLSRPPAGQRNASEACFATLDEDERQRSHAHFLHQKGAPFLQTMRWARPVGPGSNRPADKITPGPGAYGKLHSWPSTGFIGTARGFNHNSMSSMKA